MSDSAGEPAGEPQIPEGFNEQAFLIVSSKMVEYRQIFQIMVAAGWTEPQAIQFVARLFHNFLGEL